jgi:hypothetical protein
MARILGVQDDRSFALNRPDLITLITLSTATNTTIPVPNGATHAFFAATQNFAATFSSSASQAQAASWSSAASSGSEINPTVRFLGKNQVPDIGVIGAAVGFLSISWFYTGSTST